MGCQKVPKSVSNISDFFLFIELKYISLGKHFLITSIFETLCYDAQFFMVRVKVSESQIKKNICILWIF